MKRIFALLLAVTLLLTGCGRQEPQIAEQTAPPPMQTEAEENTPPVAIPAPWENAEVADFSIRLLRASMEEGKNTLISPISVLAALSMTANAHPNGNGTGSKTGFLKCLVLVRYRQKRR